MSILEQTGGVSVVEHRAVAENVLRLLQRAECPEQRRLYGFVARLRLAETAPRILDLLRLGPVAEGLAYAMLDTLAALRDEVRIPVIAITRSGRWRSVVPEHRDHPAR